MGTRSSATCRDCGFTFTVSEGGGFKFHLLHCDRCGKSKGVGFDELGDMHWRYLKGRGGSTYYGIGDRLADDEAYLERCSDDPVSEAEYYAYIEKTAGQCPCGGSFKLDVSPRCPRCKSANYDLAWPTVFYD